MEIHMRWVPVEEALPDKHQPVILCRQNKEGHLLVEQGCLSVNGWWLVYGTRVKRVKFWMPMPGAPVPGSDNPSVTADAVPAPGGELAEGQERLAWAITQGSLAREVRCG